MPGSRTRFRGLSFPGVTGRLRWIGESGLEPPFWGAKEPAPRTAPEKDEKPAYPGPRCAGAALIPGYAVVPRDSRWGGMPLVSPNGSEAGQAGLCLPDVL